MGDNHFVGSMLDRYVTMDVDELVAAQEEMLLVAIFPL
jgi:hypothetical protein